MEDPILASYLKEFQTAFDFKNLKEADLFEFFSAYCVYFRDFSEHTDLEEVVVGGTNDSALDAVGIFLNDIFVASTFQVDEIASRVRLEADFAFVQAKTSRTLNAAEIGSFLQGVRVCLENRGYGIPSDCGL